MTLGAIAFDGESGFAVMAATAGLALFHILHGYRFSAAIGEGFGVAVTALVDLGVEIMAEVTNDSATGILECQVGWFVADVAFVAVT